MTAVLIIVIAVAVLLLVQLATARHAGYRVGGAVVVRCSKGHVFRTLWVPGVSFKAVRLGLVRFQRCPVGHHWALVTPANEADLTDEQRRLADENDYSIIP
jgi:hypothetical protein